MTIGTGADRGAQPERTVLAWTRTSLAVLANGVLLLIRDPVMAREHPQPAGVVLGAAAVVAAAVVYLIGVRRQRALCVRPLPRSTTARRAVTVAGVMIGALISIVVGHLALPLW
jgi:uncharacterized membrane protein YidH (DUF202 family)